MQHMHTLQNTLLSVLQWLLPPALGVAGDVVFEAVLLYLQSVIERPIQLLHCHLDGTLQKKTNGQNLGFYLKDITTSWI